MVTLRTRFRTLKGNVEDDLLDVDGVEVVVEGDRVRDVDGDVIDIKNAAKQHHYS